MGCKTSVGGKVAVFNSFKWEHKYNAIVAGNCNELFLEKNKPLIIRFIRELSLN